MILALRQEVQQPKFTKKRLMRMTDYMGVFTVAVVMGVWTGILEAP